jgi:hypothetical protein
VGGHEQYYPEKDKNSREYRTPLIVRKQSGSLVLRGAALRASEKLTSCPRLSRAERREPNHECPSLGNNQSPAMFDGSFDSNKPKSFDFDFPSWIDHLQPRERTAAKRTNCFLPRTYVFSAPSPFTSLENPPVVTSVIDRQRTQTHCHHCLGIGGKLSQLLSPSSSTSCLPVLMRPLLIPPDREALRKSTLTS